MPASFCIDSHCHLDSRDFDADREAVIERSFAAGLSHMITIGAGYGKNSAAQAVAIAEKHPNIFCTVGIHPCDIPSDYDLGELRALAQHPKVVAIGETGLDYFRAEEHKEAQLKAFEAHIQLALEVKKPLVIHCRAAASDTATLESGHISAPATDAFNLLKNTGASKVGGVFHCFVEGVIFAEQLREINCIISLPGILTFKNGTLSREVAKHTSLERIMVETDAPYLAPVPFRGKRCEPGFVIETTKALAAAKGITFEDAALATSKNARRFYGLA